MWMHQVGRATGHAGGGACCYQARSPAGKPPACGGGWFCAEPVMSRRPCSRPRAATRCAPRFGAEPTPRVSPRPAAAGPPAGKPPSTEPGAAVPAAGAPASGPVATEPRAAPVAGIPSPSSSAVQVDGRVRAGRPARLREPRRRRQRRSTGMHPEPETEEEYTMTPSRRILLF